MKRSPAVAGQFYPGDDEILRRAIAQYTPDPGPEKSEALAVVSPHAGYMYSGGVAGETFCRVVIPRDVVVLGPNHHGLGARLAVMDQGSWQMPMGEVEINQELATLLCSHSDLFQSDSRAHQPEHSLEVQVPFLQFSQPQIRLTPVCASYISLDECRQAGESLAAAIKEYGKPVLMVASTDMSHYESRAEASRKDHLAMQHIEQLDPTGLYQTVIGNRISMCGIIPTTITLFAALELGAKEAELVRYTDSGEASGDTLQVVGYAGYVIR